jgi:hypothetical protein
MPDPQKATGTTYNPLYDPQTDNAAIEDKTQELINKPLVDESGFDPEDEKFVKDVVAKFESGEINRHSPSSLLNQKIYENLEQDKQGKADQNAFNILSRLREIYDLWQIDSSPTFQMKNQIHSIRLIKENLEEELGDVYII